MPRRKITFGDWLRGTMAAARDGNLMRPLVSQRYINAAHDERVAQYRQAVSGAEEIQRRALGRLGIQSLAKASAPTWEKYSSSESAAGPQTDYYYGYVGERDNRKKVHVAIDSRGNLLYVRDIDGKELYNHHTDGPPPSDWNFSGK